MLPYRMQSARAPSCTRTTVDAKLMERTGLDEFSLRRLRREFMTYFHHLSYIEKKALLEDGTCPRFRFMVTVMGRLWSSGRWEAWLRFLEHSQRDIDEMCRGEYPISPYLIRVFSALFGIKVDFLLLGASPCVDKTGASIDIWPLAGTP